MAVLFTLNGTVEQGLLLKDALCFLYKYHAQINNPDYDPSDPDSEELIPNPEDQATFARRMYTQFGKDSIKKYKADLADAARVAAVEEAETETNGMETT